ncbi:MAG: hypothetical protein GY847_35380 [Proteobacteria bacterium]|nr:hypothetical protein [Pseudomonadota bacterium]
MQIPRQSRESDLALLEQFDDDLARGFDVITGIDNVEAVVGIPFRDEDDTLFHVVQIARLGLEKAGLSGRSVVLIVGPKEERAEAALNAILAWDGSDKAVPVRGFLLDRNFEGRGWSIRAIMEIASRLGCPLVLLPPDLLSQFDREGSGDFGFSPSWITRILDPIRANGQDLVLARYCLHPFSHPVESLLAFPILAGVFGFRLRQPTPGVRAMSHKLMHNCLLANRGWPKEIGTFGFDPWLVVQALTAELSICEVSLGLASFSHGIGNLKRVFRQVTHVLLNQVINQSKWWMERSNTVSSPRVSGPRLSVSPPLRSLYTKELLRRSKSEFDHFNDTLFREIVTDKLRQRMEQMIDQGADGIGLSAEEWIHAVRDFLIAARFEGNFHPGDIVDGLFPFFLARLAGFIDEVKSLEYALSEGVGIPHFKIDEIVRHEAEIILEHQADAFVSEWPDFHRSWREKETQSEPYLPLLGAWEFVPHVGVMLPQEIKKADGSSVWANKIYQELIDRYRAEFKHFLVDYLHLEEMTDSSEILVRIHKFMRRLDLALDVDLFRVDLQTVKGADEMAGQICRAFAPDQTFQLKPEAIRAILRRTPPSNLIMQLGCNNVSGLLERFDPNDALGMAAWTDRQDYLDSVLDIISREGQSDWFHTAPLKHVVVDLSYLVNATEVRGTAALARLAGRVLLGNYDKGWGGEFQKLWFFLKVIKSIVGVELFSEIWQGFAASRIDLQQRIVSSIRGHWGRCVLSAHNAFENRHQRILAKRLKRFAANLEEQHPDKSDVAVLLRATAEVYHLSITLPDATFIPLSAWTWASYSHRGGVGAPTPLSSLVERDWATRDFLTACVEEAELGNEQTIDNKIVELIGQGRESEDLRSHLLGVSADPDQFVVHQSLIPRAPAPPAGKLARPVNGPILEPIEDRKWESRYVLNTAAIRLDGTVYLLYRAFGEDEISRIGLAWTRDGIHIDGRLDRPIFGPDHPTESAGCEDPRVTVIGDRMYMLYTAWDGKLAQIAMASIPVQAFIEHRFDAWKRHGLGFPGLPNKDAVLYPELFDGQYVIYHRLDPNLWISYMDSLDCPWPRTGQQIVVGPRPGMMWDGVKIGAGAQPIKTTKGWLNIYHGVDYERSYRLGVLFMSLKDPAKVIYQSPGPILEPETEFEIGKSTSRDFWVPHVVFTCGAVPGNDKEILDIDDEIFVYYGAADTAIGVAKATLRDLVPTIGDLN